MNIAETTGVATYTVAVIDADPRVRTMLAMQLGESAQPLSFPSLDVFDAKTGPGTSVVVVLGPSFADVEGISAIIALKGRRPAVSVVLVTAELSTTVLQQAMRAGVSDVLAMPVDRDQLGDALRRAVDSLPAIAPAVPSAPAHQDDAPKPSGRVISVFSAKGGAGKSMVAANLAVLLARRSDRPVALLDADLQFGDTAVMLKLSPQHTVVDAVNSIDRLDVQLLQSLLVRHESGVLVLPAPTEPAFADQVSAQDMLKIVGLLREICGHVVVDTPALFNEVILSMLEGSDDIVLVAGMDIPNIKNVKIGLQTLRLLGIPMSKLKLVLNRANSKVKLDIGEVERTLQLKADCLIPSDIVVPRSVNKGVPAVLDEPKSGVARSLEQLADLFMPAGARRR